MRYLMMIKSAEKFRDQMPPQALMDAMGVFVAEGFKSGALKDTAGLKPSSEAVRIRQSGGKLKISDGPFTESKEVIGGFAIVETATREEALTIAREFMELHVKHWPEFEAESEVRPMEDG